MMDRVVGRRLFTDGIEREGYEDDSERQYVFGPDSEQVFGQWLLPADKPLVIGPVGVQFLRPDERARHGRTFVPFYTRLQGPRGPSGVVRNAKTPGTPGFFTPSSFTSPCHFRDFH
jgi:hypothetical protein